MSISHLIDDLSRVVERVEGDASFSVVEVQFGARALHVHSRNLDDIPVAGLLASSGRKPSASLYVVNSGDVGDLRFPAERKLAPYGAILETLPTDWRVTHDIETGRVLALDLERRIAIFYPGLTLPPRERAEFCRPLLHWLAILDGNVVIHAGALSREGRGLLVAGPGNAGKSTLTRVCLAAGFDFLGDNAVEVGLGAAATIYPAYPTFKIRRHPAVPIADSWPEPTWDDEAEKDIYFLSGLVGASLPCEHVATLILDERGPSTPSSLGIGAAAFRVAPNTVAQFPFFESETLTRTGRVVALRPNFEAGRMDVAVIPQIVADLLESERGVHA